MKLYSVKEAAKLVGVSTNTLYKYLDEDRIHAARGSRVQGRFRIPESALEEFLGVKLSEPPKPVEEASQESSVVTPPLSEMIEEKVESVNHSIPAKRSSKLPLRIVRFLLLLSLIAILLDLFIARSVSFPAQLSRLFFILIMILLSYQEGGYRRG